MKNKSFLFLIAALALGLAFASCGGDTEIEYRDRDKPLTYVGYNDALAIMDAFKRGDVYLTAETDLTPATPLLIPENRTLYLNGQTVIVGSNSVIIKAGDLAWTGTDDPTGESSKIEAGSKGAVLINITADPTHYGSAGVFGAEGTASFTFVPFGEVKSANGVNYFASQTDSAIFNTAGSLATGGGTTAYFIGDRNANGVLNTNSGTLVVTGNLTGLTTLTTNTPLMVYGELAGGTNAAADFITGNGKVEANKVTASGGKIGTLSTRTGNFNGDVEFVGVSNVDNAIFANNTKVGGNATVGRLSFSGTGNTLVLTAGGEIIFTGGTTPTFFTSAGTLAALGGSVSFKVTSATELEVNGNTAGTFALGNNQIDLAASNKQIKVAGTTGVFFNGAGSIAGETYSIGDDAGTLSTNNGFILTKNGIAVLTSGTKPTLSYSVATAKFLNVKDGGAATIDGVNVSLTSGSISVKTGQLILTNGGSITTSAGANNIAWGGTIAGSAAGGSLLVGSIATASPEGAILAGSVGTSSSPVVGVIVSNSGFLTTSVSVANGKTGAGLFNDGGSATAAGSILIFGNSN